MNNRYFSTFYTAAFSIAVFSTAGCGQLLATVEPSVPSISGAVLANQPGADAAAAQWSDIKDYTYDMRGRFFVGLKLLEAKVDGQFRELKAKRSAMTSATDTKAWDFAMKEMGDARSSLKSVGEELGKASVDTWNQQKEVVGLAWQRSQDAYAKVKSTTTN